MVQLSACDSLDDWSTVNGTDALDTIDKQEGGASIKVTGSGAGSVFIEQTYEPFSCMNLSESDHIAFWFKTEINVALRLRVYSGVDPETSYLEWVAKFRVQVKKNNVWYKVKLYLNDYDYSEGVFLPALTEAIIIKVWESVGGGDAFWIDDVCENLADPLKVTLGTGAEEDYVSDDVLELDIWSEDMKVGRWQLLLKNLGDKWGGLLHTNDDAQLKINGVTMMNGYLDDAVNELDERGVYTNNFVVPGRDYGRDLAKLYYTYACVDIKVDDLLEIILTAVGSEITYTSPSTAPVVNMDHKRMFLIDWLQAGGKRINYSAYVDLTKALHFFALGAVAEESGVALKSIAGAMDNNILDLKKGEEIGFSIANKIELTAGSLKDHYTDGNAVDFTPSGGDTDVVNDPTEKQNGISSIKFFCTVNSFPVITLDFSAGLYSRNALDLSNSEEMTYKFRYTAIPANLSIRPRLEDADGNVVEFKRTQPWIGVAQKGKTDLTVQDTWHKLQIPIGIAEDNPIKNNETENRWYYTPTGHITTFDWSSIKKIIFGSHQVATQGAASIWIDDLCIPSLEVISLVEDAVSIAAYDVAMWWDERKDIRSIIELDAVAVSELDKRKDPLQTIRVFAAGQTGSKYAGQSVTVQAPGHGLATATKYRIVKLHHMVRKNSIMKGENFVTEYDLIKHTINPIQVIDDLRYGLASDPRGTMIEVLNLTRRRVRSAEATERQDFGDTHPVSTVFYSGSGVVFPEDPRDGFIFVLTADILGPPVYYGDEGVTYQYDAGTETWIRGPMLLRRATQPPVGGEVIGDFWRNTTTNILYEWSGADWDQIGSLNLADTPDFDTVEWPTDQLAIETRGWATNLGFIWDEETPDWNKIWWGQGGDEKITDASIKFKDGMTIGVNKGTVADHDEGIWFYYWDEGYKSGDPLKYDLQKTQDFAESVGPGKGQIAYVEINNTDEETPSLIVGDGYTPVFGVGVLGVGSVWGKHLSFKWITGKNYRTAGRAETPKVAGIEFNDTGLVGYSGATQKAFELLTSGVASVFGPGKFRLKLLNGSIVGDLDIGNYAGRDAVRLWTTGSSNDLILEAGGYYIKIRGDTGDIQILGSSTLDVSNARMLIPLIAGDPTSPSPRDGEMWIDTTV